MNNLISLGKLVRAHGLKGDLFIDLDSKTCDFLKDIKEFYLICPKTKKSFLFDLKYYKAHKSGAILNSSQITDIDEVLKFKNFEFALDKKDFKSDSDEFYLESVKGFKLYDKGHCLGVISSLSSNGAQDLFVLGEGKESILIPFVDEWFEKVDFSNKEIFFNLPEGLY